MRNAEKSQNKLNLTGKIGRTASIIPFARGYWVAVARGGR